MLYPPNLKSSLPAFVATSQYDITFTLPSFVAAGDIGHMLVYIVKLANNLTIADTNKYPDGVIYLSMVGMNADGTYTATVTDSDLNSTGWEPGVVYKIQMRFGTSSNLSWKNDLTTFATWKQTLVNTSGAFSEWSVVMVTKCIESPTFKIKNAESLGKYTVTSERFEGSTTPLFEGSWSLDVSVNHEALDKYKFDIYEGSGVDETALLESSGWIQDLGAGLRTHRFKTALTNGQTYTVTYSIRTINGYEATDEAPYIFTVAVTDLGILSGVTIVALDCQLEDDTLLYEQSYCNENGCINIYLSADGEITGNYVLSRTSEKSNYRVWEDIKYLLYSNQELSNTLVYLDFTVESGIHYQYGILKENDQGLRTSIKQENPVVNRYVDFEYSYLFRDDTLLKLLFNQTINSFKHTTLRSKQDTIGDKYPHLVANGHAYYAEFPITGLISLHMDEARTFFKEGNGGLYYKGELVVPDERFSASENRREHLTYNDSALVIGNNITDNDGVHFKKYAARETYSSEYAYLSDMYAGEDTPRIDDPTGPLPAPIVDPNHRHTTPVSLADPARLIDTNLTHNNIFIERVFREKVEEFLNNFDYLLYKSPTEGNIVVGLMNVSMTPKRELGRMIFEFSATAYEVLENTLDNLNEYGIIDIGGWETLATSEVFQSFGLISMIYEAGAPIYDLIKQEQNVPIGDEGYSHELKRVTSIWIDQYPQEELDTIVLEKLLRDLETLYPDKEDHKEEKKALLDLIDALEKINAVLADVAVAPLATTLLEINGKQVMVMPRKIYAVEDGITSLSLISTNYPIVVNYECLVGVVEDPNKKTASAIDTSVVWGLIAGVFTETDSVLRKYDYDYLTHLSENFRVYNPDPTTNVLVYDDKGHEFIVIDDTTFNVYRTLNLLDVIKQEVRRLIEYDYDMTFIEDEDGWHNEAGTLYYYFGELMSFDIEGDEGNVIYVNESPVTLTNKPATDADSFKRLITNKSDVWIDENDESANYDQYLRPGCRYVSPVSAQNLSLKRSESGRPRYLVINYKCSTRQITMK